MVTRVNWKTRERSHSIEQLSSQKVKAFTSALKLVHALGRMLKKFSHAQAKSCTRKFSRKQKQLHQAKLFKVDSSMRTLKAVYRRKRVDAANETAMYNPYKL